jgi:hypothetical protein
MGGAAARAAGDSATGQALVRAKVDRRAAREGARSHADAGRWRRPGPRRGLRRRGGAGGAPLLRPLPHAAELLLVIASFSTEVTGTQWMPRTACMRVKLAQVRLTARQAHGQGAARADRVWSSRPWTWPAAACRGA